jgi:hypothetical protein
VADLNNMVGTGPAVELWKRTLSQIPTRFGRLVFVSSLRDSVGRYLYPPLIEAMGCEITDRTLASSHYTVFSEWIASSLADQKADLDAYLKSHREAGGVDCYRELIPAGAHEVERQLYLTDLETLLTATRFVAACASSIPGA